MPKRITSEEVATATIDWPKGFATNQTAEEYTRVCGDMVAAVGTIARATPMWWQVNEVAEKLRGAGVVDRAAALRRQRYDAANRADSKPPPRPQTIEQEFERGAMKLVRDAVLALAEAGHVEIDRPADKGKQAGKGGTLTFRVLTEDEVAARQTAREAATQLTAANHPPKPKREPRPAGHPVECNDEKEQALVTRFLTEYRAMQEADSQKAVSHLTKGELGTAPGASPPS